MDIGLIGLPQVGKSLLFRLLAGEGRGGPGQATVGMASVPDPRLDRLAALYKPRKVTPAALQVTDIPGAVPGEDRARWNRFLEAVRGADVLVHVIRAFGGGSLPHVLGEVDPLRDARLIRDELILTDLATVESARQRLEATPPRKRRPDDQALLERLPEMQALLEQERPLRELSWTDEDLRLVKGFGLLTLKPLVLAVNVDEGQLQQGTFPGEEALRQAAAQWGEPLITFCGPVEAEIAELPAGEREAFMGEYGIGEPGVARLARAAYEASGLISFFTAGEEEVRAWPIRRGLTAKQAAGKIHSDIERGFIRAEVVAYEDLIRLGSMAAVREAGLLRLEGRDYVVQDGDVILFRFNV
ncbi:redox-regulated ATPase YchF [Thermaerobacter sp. PB12/4term]|uniref:redox-regulated ATPase YchF n=1 Tax=Thermaerobacter sp. PB12/4term TaxID=2293838 RepID=UPI000E328513|nr:redox-regulated ATPase YchF [Thermaerobacter sp. PB12/4term]QIA27819.1 redox-regulated ATPase YchF [Thermaerobacter sp. PB12/4term]